MDFITQHKHTTAVVHKYRVTIPRNANEAVLKSNAAAGATLSAEEKDEQVPEGSLKNGSGHKPFLLDS